MASSGNIRAGRAYIELSTKGEELKGLRRAQAKLKAFSVTADAVGSKLLRTGTMMLLPLATSAKTFADFDKQMAKVSTMLDDPSKYMQKYSAAIKKMAVEFGESTEALTNGLYDILSASVDPAKALDVLTVSVKAAKAGMTDTGIAADAITTILNAYGLAANKAGNVSDLLFSIVRKGKTTFAELAPSIGLVATTAASANVSMEEFGAAIATMTRNGVKTENAITALNAIISTFLKPEKQAAEYARALGFELSSATIKAEGLRGVFQRISNMPPDAIARLFPNIRALRGVLPALKNMSGYLNDITVMGNRDGATDEAFNKMIGNASHQLDQYKRIALNTLREIGAGVMAALGVWGDSFADSVKDMGEWASKNKATIVQVTTLTRNILLLGVGFKTLAIGIRLVSMAMALNNASIASSSVMMLSYSTTIKLAYRQMGLFKASSIAVQSAVMRLGRSMTIGLSAGLATIGLVNSVMSHLSDHTAELNDEMAERLQKGNEERSQDKMKLERLQQLASKRKLNNQQENEALTLVGELEKKYGKLGITYDAITKKLTVMASANKKLNKETAARELLQAKKALGETDNNISELRQEQYAQDHWSKNNLWSILSGGNDAAIAKAKDADKKLITELNKKAALDKRIKELNKIINGKSSETDNNKNGLQNRISQDKAGATIENTLILGDTEYENAKKKLAKLDEDIARKRRSEIDNEIAKIKQLADTRRKLLESLIATEKSKGFGKADQWHIEEWQKQLDAIDAQVKQDIGIKQFQRDQKNERGVKNLLHDIKKDFRNITDSERDFKDRQNIEKNPGQAVFDFTQKTKDSKAEFIEAAEKLKDAVNNAKEDGKILKPEQENIDRLKEQFYRAYGNFSGNRDKLKQAMDGVKAKMETRGSFRFDARAMGGNEIVSPLKQINQNMKELKTIGKEIHRTVKKIDTGGVNIT